MTQQRLEAGGEIRESDLEIDAGTRSSGERTARAASLKQREKSSTRSRAIVTPAALR